MWYVLVSGANESSSEDGNMIVGVGVGTVGCKSGANESSSEDGNVTYAVSFRSSDSVRRQ